MRRVRRCWRRCRSLESFVRRDWFGRQTGCRPTLLKFAVCDSGGGRCGKGGPGQAAALRLGGRRRAPTSLRCAVSWLRRGTHSVRYARSVQTTATSQTTMRAARAATSPVLLGASEARRRLPEPAFAEPVVVFVTQATDGGGRGRRCPLGAMSGATRSTAPGSARASALRRLTCRSCLNGATAGRAVSSAARPWREHRSAVGLQGRPPQHEPPAGSACRDSALTAAQRRCQ